MKRILLAAAILAGVASSAKAQIYGSNDAMPRISAGFGVGGTIGSQASAYPAAGALNLNFELPLGQDIPVSAMLKTGYTFFVSKDGYSYSSDYGTTGSIVSFIPLQIGARAYAGKLFFEADAGASFCINSNTELYTNKKTALLVSPAIGYGFRFGSSEKFGLDMSLAYEARIEPHKDVVVYNDGFNTYTSSYGSYNQIAFHLAFSFGL